MSPSNARHFDAARLKELQAQSGLTNRVVAERVDVDVRLLGKWRAGEVTPSGGNLIALADALGCSADSFYTEMEEAA
jgi:transcriptional regulator with XRE-family HTH domain